MPDVIGALMWLEESPLGKGIRESLWLFPIIETLHLFGIVLLVGATSALDLRLMGLTMRTEPVSRLAGRLLPWALVGFLVQIVTGSLCSHLRRPGATRTLHSAIRCSGSYWPGSTRSISTTQAIKTCASGMMHRPDLQERRSQALFQSCSGSVLLPQDDGLHSFSLK